MASIEAETRRGPLSEFATFAFGAGYDADVVARAEERPQSKIWLGGAHYAQSALAKLLTEWRSRPANLEAAIDGDRATGVAVLVQVHFPYTYFGPMPLRITDGPVDGLATIVVDSLQVLRAAEIFVRAATRRPLPQRLGAAVWEGFGELAIDADPATPLQADGEFLGVASRVVVTEAPDSLLALRMDQD
jgi:diacylglycerol kinase family enzyme